MPQNCYCTVESVTQDIHGWNPLSTSFELTEFRSYLYNGQLEGNFNLSKWWLSPT